MRIASWNVNSAKARQDHILDYLKAGSADVLLIQETKTQDVNFPVDLYRDAGWNVVFHGQKSYNGVAIAARQPLTDVMSGFPGDAEDEQARYMEATIDGVRVATIYLPNGNPAPGPKFDYKLAWMERLNLRAEQLLQDEIPVVLAGDFNVIPQDIDCYDPPGWEGDALTRAESRAAFNRLSHLGYTDALRACHPGQVLYSYWDYQAGAWQKDNGVRIDHLMLSPEAADRLVAAEVDKGPRGLEKPSDHTPVWVELRD
ncbi:MAG: exodeoxyribonuclease III [Candidatus Puniceispirillaceae bacterium]